jgi:hypothetical protein
LMPGSRLLLQNLKPFVFTLIIMFDCMQRISRRIPFPVFPAG